MSEYIRSSKLLYYQERFENRDRPISAEMIMTNFCNYDCAYCRYKHGAGYFRFEDFKRAVEKLQGMGVRGFILTGGGEPVLNPDIDRILSWLEQSNVRYGINTNMTRYISHDPDWVKVSLHENHDLENVLTNLRRFRLEHPSTVLGIQLIVENAEDIRPLYDRYQSLDVDYMAFRPLEVQYEAYDDPDGIIAELEALRAADDKVLINYKWYMLERRFERCAANWVVITVDYLGDVWYCCHKPQEVVGNLFADVDIMQLKNAWVSDMSRCDVPCRMTCNNIIVAEHTPGPHIEFI